MKQRIIDIIENSNYDYYGVRMDDYNYALNDIMHNSHQLFQDAMFDNEDNLLYPYITKGIYKGFMMLGN